MSRSIDRNDVDISRLFQWSKEVLIQDAFLGKEAKVYMRLVGDADLNRAKVHSYRRASLLRKALKTEDSDERVSYLANIDDYENIEMLVQTVILLELPEMHQQVIRDIDVPEPKEPGSDAPQEAWEKYQEKVDNYPQRFSEVIEKDITSLRDKRYKELKKKSEQELYKIYESTVINRLCEDELQNAFYDMCTFLGTYKDKTFKNKTFTSIEEFENLHTTLKNKLRDEYRSLEIGADLLKKLPEAMV